MSTAPLAPLARRLPDPDDVTSDVLLERFLDYVDEKGLSLYPAQEEALLELYADKNLILATPTGSGKSLVAAALHFKAMAEGRRSFYTCPIKALVSEKFFALCADFGPDNVGMMTGDASVNRDAPIICCTAEILANMALREGDEADVDYVVMDEFHYYADRDRGVAWQIPLLTLPRATFLLMSATLGPTERFERALTELNGQPTAVVRTMERPVPLDYDYRETPLHETVNRLVQQGKHPVYLVCFTQRAAAEEAQNLMSLDYSSKEEKRAIADALTGVRWSSPYAKEFQRFLRHGIGLHHAGLLPKYRLLVEKLAQQGLLKIICGTDTLGVGVNIPIRTVLFTKLCKYDGEKTAILNVRDFQQISGRAGRKGFDVQGSVVAQAPEHVIENLRLEAKASSTDSGKKRKVVKKKPPEKGYVHWDKLTFDRLVTSAPEPLVPRFQVTHGMLLNVLSRPAGGCGAMKKLIRGSHEPPGARRQLGRTAVQLFRSLVHAKIVELRPYREGGIRINADLQEDFSLNHALSLYLVDTLNRVDPDLPGHELAYLTLVESILENPDLILQKQLDRVKRDKLNELKAQGVEFDARIAALENLEYPKPEREFIYDSFNAFAERHPWVGQENIRPKSVAREMYETYQSFGEYIREYNLERAEGLLLRYLSEVYKACVQSVPDWAKDEDFAEVIAYFAELVRGVDSSLIDEWERMRDPSYRPKDQVDAEAVAAQRPDITRDARAFTVLVRNALFRLLRALATQDWELAASLIDDAAEGDEPWTPERLDQAMQPFFAEHARVRLDPAARVPANTMIEPANEGLAWQVTQVVSDDEGNNDFLLSVLIDLDRSREAARPVLRLLRVGA
jgi:superfamily II RNA helicase